MIQTNNPELDAAFAELQTQVQTLSEGNALKAGNIAGLRVELKAANEKIAELEKKLQDLATKPTADLGLADVHPARP